MFLYEQMDTLKQTGYLLPIPQYVRDNISQKFDIRDYQKNAFENFITYYNSDLRKNKQLHLLFHMATGSGKTLIMAGLIIYLYKQGYRNFLFFVNLSNVVEKTKDNFLNQQSNKYLFNDKIIIDGEYIEIKEVSNFQESNQNCINICFISTQKLHLDLSIPKEGSLTLEDFEDKKVVLISDESHHINTETKKSKSAQIEHLSWEYSVNKVFHANRDNVLLEFTATCDLKDPNVLAKYQDKIIYDYPLVKFRESKYTKDFQNLQSDYDMWERTLQALVLSQYRLKLFAEYGQNIKPVILLKSQKIDESKSFYEEFYRKLYNLTVDDLVFLNNGNNPIITRCFDYFSRNEVRLEGLVEELKQEFSEEHSIIINGSTDNSAEKQIAVNSLEDKKNPFRIIFTVDMLNEGWDVLNLFDIVRLYETRQSGNKVSPYTIREAQLIGRGARYCPFKINNYQDKFRRKYDEDISNEMRVCETLYYHSKQDSRYISELREALKEIGLLPKQKVEVKYILKDTFKTDELYKSGYVFTNSKVVKSRNSITEIEKKIRHSVYSIKTTKGNTTIYNLFGEDKIDGAAKTYKHSIKMKDIDISICFNAIHRFDTLKFNVIKSYFPNLTSTKEFITSLDYLGNITINITSNNEVLQAKDLYVSCIEVYKNIAEYISRIEIEYEGTSNFIAKRLHDVIRDKVRYIDNPHGDGEGISQSVVSEDIRLDLMSQDWYVFNDNYGTTEEKKFIFYFSQIVEELKKKYNKVYLIRNERFPELAIYDFDTGERFEPDYILILHKNYNDGYEQQQLFIEPKGEGYILKDRWKEDFLLQLEKRAIPTVKYADDNEYKIIGLPFYNAEKNTDVFEQALEEFYK